MKSSERESFADLREFRDHARKLARLVFYHVFRGDPDARLMDSLTHCRPDEALVLLDIDEDRGFLASTDVTVDITPDGTFITKKMAECPGLGAWTKGIPVAFVDDPGEVESLIAYARRFAFPPERAATMSRSDTQPEAV